MTSERSKRRDLLAFSFITKSRIFGMFFYEIVGETPLPSVLRQDTLLS